MKKLITSKEIEEWRPDSFAQVVGCDFAKSSVSDAVNATGDIPNIMITGDSGSGKTCLVRLASKGALCLGTGKRPCQCCEKCKGIDVRFSESGLFLVGDEVVRNYHVIDCCNISQDELNETIIQLRDVGSHIVVLDEAHGLRRRQMDFSLLEPIENCLRTTWIASTAYPEKLDASFMRRFTVRARTSSPSKTDCTAFIRQRCNEWSIELEAGAAKLLSWKSGQNVSECIRLLAMSASAKDRKLSLNLIQEFQFLDLKQDGED